MASYYKIPRGTLANLDSLAGSNGLIPYAQYWITDQGKMAVATSASAYVILGSGGEATPGWQVTATGTGASQNITLPETIAVTGVFVFINGVFQRPTTDYTISGTTLTTTSYTSGDSIVIIKPAGNPGASGVPGANALLGWTGGIDGLMADNETIQLGFAPSAVTLTQANCKFWALTGATASKTLTIYKKTSVGGAPSTVGTAVFTAGGQGGAQAATVTISNSSIEDGAMVYIGGPAVADTTLANINYLIR